jgi:hypothetical protein
LMESWVMISIDFISPVHVTSIRTEVPNTTKSLCPFESSSF